MRCHAQAIAWGVAESSAEKGGADEALLATPALCDSLAFHVMNETLERLRAGELAGATRLDLSCGLTEFPREIFDLADTLEVLSLTGNHLSSLPDDLPRLHKLRILFCSSNDFTHLPAVIGECESLSMIGFKSNRIETIDDGAFPSALRWLILTDNRIRKLPATLGRCTRLQKLMLAGNELTELPRELSTCENLELIRIAANRFESLPDWLLKLPRLTWLALSRNPCAPLPSLPRDTMRQIDWSELKLEAKLGEGASGVIHRALWQPQSLAVAVKIFKGVMTSDGLPASEMAACIAAGSHPNLIEMLGQVANHPDGGEGLVMSLIDPQSRNLAAPPDFDTCTRDIYEEGRQFDLPELLHIAHGIASAAQRLHAHGIMHGDLYAHNVLTNARGDCLLGDFGAASFYESAHGDDLQRIEVRAFGCLLEELLARCNSKPEDRDIIDPLADLQRRCLTTDVSQRPLFDESEDSLRKLIPR